MKDPLESKAEPNLLLRFIGRLCGLPLTFAMTSATCLVLTRETGGGSLTAAETGHTHTSRSSSGRPEEAETSGGKTEAWSRRRPGTKWSANGPTDARDDGGYLPGQLGR